MIAFMEIYYLFLNTDKTLMIIDSSGNKVFYRRFIDTAPTDLKEYWNKEVTLYQKSNSVIKIMVN